MMLRNTNKYQCGWLLNISSIYSESDSESV